MLLGGSFRLRPGGGGVPPVVCVSEPLRAAAEADPLIVVEMASSTDLWGPTRIFGLDPSRDDHDSGDRVDIITVPELEMVPDAAELADPHRVAPLVRNGGGLVPRMVNLIPG